MQDLGFYWPTIQQVIVRELLVLLASKFAIIISVESSSIFTTMGYCDNHNIMVEPPIVSGVTLLCSYTGPKSLYQV